jgi:hypothetical protein
VNLTEDRQVVIVPISAEGYARTEHFSTRRWRKGREAGRLFQRRMYRQRREWIR